MIEFKVSAPGKIILFGEHAVVYGRTAVASSINLRTTLKFTERKRSQCSKNNIKIEFPDIKLSFKLPFNVFLNYFFKDNFNYPLVKKNDQLHSCVSAFFDSIKDSTDNSNNEITEEQKLSLQAFFYLLVYIAYEECIDIKETSLHVHLSTELKVGTGLGSSASFAVCLSACFLHWSFLQKGNHHSEFNKNELDKISQYALNCEKIMHESPSGIDNSVCTYGSMIKFQHKRVINTLSHISNIKILLVNTNITRSTKSQIKRAARTRDLYPGIINPILDCIDKCSQNAWEIFTEMNKNVNKATIFMEENWFEKLSTLMNMNQGFLISLDVTHPKLEIICALADMYSYGAKLTGAGGGGYAYILLPPDVENKSIKLFSKQLHEKGFDVTMTSLGDSGVKIEDLE
ncbi:PREDICTED: mevalonate kinase-like [Acromyrmex echinatior]|uniref:Mevalonate kinase n=1 Tax=Acromyrmex echinatior TaxID=103372 RepID=F4WJE7_ACREC|nr:PREDICTED: mevalonate kinase-like [Acromyrmex echinatior]EGI65725.1 Mevalonate kinase [Acromyrmex echinatior]